MIARFKGFVFYVWTFSAVVLSGPFIVPYSILVRDPRFVFRSVVHFITLALFLFRVKVTVRGREHMDPDKPYLVLSNHQSFLDIPLVLKYVRILSFLAKIEIKKWPFFGYTMNQMDCIFVDRSDPNSRSSIGHQMLEKMKKKVSFCVFPEGTRAPSWRTPLPFKRGIFKIAKSSGLEILPVTICNSGEILPKKSFQFTSGTIRFTIHKPLSSNDYSTTEELHQAVENIITQPILHPENREGR